MDDSVNERKLQHVTILAVAVIGVSAAAFFWALAGEGHSLLALLAFNGLFLLAACLICFRLGRGGEAAEPPSGAEDEADSQVLSRLRRHLGDLPEENR